MTMDVHRIRARRIAQELLTQGDLAAAGELFSPGCLHYLPGGESAAAWITTLRRAFPDLCAVVEEEVADDARVVQRLAISGTHLGPYLGLAPTGLRVEWCLVEFLHAGTDGAFAEHWAVWDRLGLVRQLGGGPDGQ
ncbi:MAG TPA: ester cyclase [Thermomicrobiales bacterium]|nr:ester cyclase [Thermomicrobiales bacterium]